MPEEDLFPPEFMARLRANLPEAERNLSLAERRLVVAKAAGADTTEAERRIYAVRQGIRKIRGAFGIS